MGELARKPGQTWPRLMQYEPNRDSYRRYVTDDPSATKFATLLRAVDDGDLASIAELQEEMEAKDALLQGIANTRRAAITALEWDVVPDDDSQDMVGREIAAAYCRTRLRKIRSFESALDHMTTAIGPNIAAVELVWFRGEVADFIPIPGHRLVICDFKDVERSGEGIRTQNHPTGVAFGELPWQFIVFNHQDRPYPYRRTMTSASVVPYLMRHFSRADWMSFSELYGSPIKKVTAEDGVPDEVRSEAQSMAEDAGADWTATFPEGLDLELLSPSGNGETYNKQLEFTQKELSILWLGQTLTTDVGAVGSFAAAKVHDNVRADLLVSDLEAEAQAVRDQLLRPMIELRFPGKKYPVPIFKRLLHERTDLEASNLRMQQVTAALSAGVPVMTDEFYEAMNLTRPPDFEPQTIGGGQANATV